MDMFDRAMAVGETMAAARHPASAEKLVEELESLRTENARLEGKFAGLKGKVGAIAELRDRAESRVAELETKLEGLASSIKAADKLAEGIRSGDCARRCEPCTMNLHHYTEIRARAALIPLPKPDPP